MITKDEIQAKSLEFGIHQANVQRDYVFGWLLVGLYTESPLKDVLVLKGGNCFRKAYFPNTRFSHDLDFSTESAVDEGLLRSEFNKVCEFVQAQSGVVFDLERNRVQLQNEIDEKRRVFDVRLYFKDFYGNADHITISLAIDITEFDRLYLPVQERQLIHPYSDSGICTVGVRCVKLEEMLASKLKCLLQRRHTADLYDLVYSIFLNRDIEVNRGEVLSTFFGKTIYERHPGVARQLLLELPLDLLRTAWNRYIVAPVEGVLDFDETLTNFRQVINDIFGDQTFVGRDALAFFPSHFRNPILQAGSEMKLLRVAYDGHVRVVEPYSLRYKRRKDGHAEEYLYVWDRTGGRASGPGLKTFLNGKIQSIQVTDETFEPRYPVELSKAGEYGPNSYFSKPFGGSSGTRRVRIAPLRHGWRYTVECSYCGRKFKRMRRSTRLNPHKDGYGNDCYGRNGYVVDQEYV
ncbi:MAG: nucleotidyl transferase AbiEii/AbiGii toxin family protein [Acidobacteria bacterium]|nr:nucleotidyl transferase AbiEii/AbiGii toxin family protein [Acidobacteriota bacterium]